MNEVLSYWPNLPDDFAKNGDLMGGIGSGRRSGFGRETTDSCRSLDVNRLHGTGCLAPGWSGSWQWMRDGERIAWINLRAEARCVILSYRVCIGDGDWEDMRELVPIIRVACRFGGSRPYFMCPGVVNGLDCRRRVAKLYAADRDFLCRHCYRLAYASQSEDARGRALRRAIGIRIRLGGDPGMLSPFPKRPKGMWRRTYARLREDALLAETLADEAFAIRTEQFRARFERLAREKGAWRYRQ